MAATTLSSSYHTFVMRKVDAPDTVTVSSLDLLSGHVDLTVLPGGYFSTTGEDPSILLRMKEDYDGAEPAPSSIAAANLVRLAALADPDAAQPLIARASAAAAAFRERLSEAALAMPQMCCALHLLDSGLSLVPPSAVNSSQT